MKHIIIYSIIIGVFLGCGNSSQNTKSNSPTLSYESKQKLEIEKKEVVAIVYNTVKTTCESSEYYNTVCQGLTTAKNILIKSYSNSKTCTDFKRSESNCDTYDGKENSENSCVIAYDLARTNQDIEEWYSQWYTNNWYLQQWNTIIEDREAEEAEEAEADRLREEEYQEELADDEYYEEQYQQEQYDNQYYEEQYQQEQYNNEYYDND